MIYVSSSCIRAEKISDAVKILAEAGFRAIELSGGTDYYPALEEDLLGLQEIHDLTYLCHNYFPPPEKHFVVNLASMNDAVYEISLLHLCENIRLSKVLGADRISFHAGFLVDIGTTEIGRELSLSTMADGERALARFAQGYAVLKEKAGGLPVYIENNVYSWANRQIYGQQSPFMLVCNDDYQRFSELMDFHFLLDVGHLQVSCHSLGLDYAGQLKSLFPHTDYLHLSDNDALCDAHGPIREHGEICRSLQGLDFTNKIVSLEICDGLDALRHSYDVVQDLFLKS